MVPLLKLNGTNETTLNAASISQEKKTTTKNKQTNKQNNIILLHFGVQSMH